MMVAAPLFVKEKLQELLTFAQEQHRMVVKGTVGSEYISSVTLCRCPSA
jgi:hypothetical protein